MIYQCLRVVGLILAWFPPSLDRHLFRLLWPLYAATHRLEIDRIEHHLLQSEISPRPRVVHIYESLFLNGLDSLRYLHERKGVEQRVHIANRQLLQNLINQGQPVVILSAHLGAFEMLHRSLTKFGRPVHLIASDFGGSGLGRWLTNLRNHNGLCIHTPEEAPRVLKQFVRKNAILALMMDQGRSGKGNQVDLLGRPSKLFLRIPQEACKLGAAVLTMRAMRRGGAHILKFETLYPAGTHPMELQRQVTLELERWILEHPEQWTWNYPGNWNVVLDTLPV